MPLGVSQSTVTCERKQSRGEVLRLRCCLCSCRQLTQTHRRWCLFYNYLSKKWRSRALDFLYFKKWRKRPIIEEIWRCWHTNGFVSWLKVNWVYTSRRSNYGTARSFHCRGIQKKKWATANRSHKVGIAQYVIRFMVAAIKIFYGQTLMTHSCAFFTQLPLIELSRAKKEMKLCLNDFEVSFDSA